MNKIPIPLQAMAYSYALRAIEYLGCPLEQPPIIMGANIRVMLNNPEVNKFNYPWKVVLSSYNKKNCFVEPKFLFDDLSVIVVYGGEKIPDILELEKFTCDQVCLARERIIFSSLFEDFMMEGEEDKRIIYTGHKKDFDTSVALKLQKEYPGYIFWSKKTNSELKIPPLSVNKRVSKGTVEPAPNLINFIGMQGLAEELLMRSPLQNEPPPALVQGGVVDAAIGDVGLVNRLQRLELGGEF